MKNDNKYMTNLGTRTEIWKKYERNMKEILENECTSMEVYLSKLELKYFNNLFRFVIEK